MTTSRSKPETPMSVEEFQQLPEQKGDIREKLLCNCGFVVFVPRSMPKSSRRTVRTGGRSRDMLVTRCFHCGTIWNIREAFAFSKGVQSVIYRE